MAWRFCRRFASSQSMAWIPDLVDLARLEHGVGDRLVLDDAVDDAVEVGAPQIELVVGGEDGLAVLAPLLQQPGPGADGRLLVQRIVVDVQVLEDVLRNGIEVGVVDGGAERLLELEHQRPVVRGGQRVEVTQIRAVGVVHLGVHHLVPGELVVLGGDRLAVAPQDVVLELEGVRHSVRRLLERLRRPVLRVEGQRVRVVAQEGGAIVGALVGAATPYPGSAAAAASRRPRSCRR